MSAVLREAVPEPVDEVDVADTGAPILLITGMPGSCKSNYVIHEFAIGKRDVYQCNIPGCTLPEFNPLKWPEELLSMPVDATLLFDEGREIFPPRNPNADPPPHYVLNRIRHTGRRVVIIAQHPNDLDSRVRRLCGRHLHFREVFGGGGAKVYEWRQRIGDVDGTCADALQWSYKVDHAAFKLYKSTDLHRGSAKVPWKVRLIKPIIIGAVLLALLGAWFTWHMMSNIGKHADPGLAGKLAAVAGVSPAAASAARSGDRGKVMTVAEYSASFAPRVVGLEYSAPRYDDITKPVRAPVPAACVQSESKGCKCYSQQATPLKVPDAICRQMVEGGFFQDFEPEGKSSEVKEGIGGRVVAQLSAPASSVVAYAAPSIAAAPAGVATADNGPGRGLALPRAVPR